MEISKLKNVINMLQSPDKENHVVGLTVMEQQEHQKAFVPLILAYKFGHPKQEAWQENAPMAFDFIKERIQIKDGAGVTFNDIFRAIIKHKAPADQMKIFMTMFGDYLTKQCHSLGYSFIDEIEMNVKFKVEEDVNAE